MSILLIVSGLIALGVFLQLLQVDLGLEASLCFKAGGEQGGLVHIPFADALEVFCAPFIVEDERRGFMPQALFEHEQPSKTAIAIGKKVDALEMNIIV